MQDNPLLYISLRKCAAKKPTTVHFLIYKYCIMLSVFIIK